MFDPLVAQDANGTGFRNTGCFRFKGDLRACVQSPATSGDNLLILRVRPYGDNECDVSPPVELEEMTLEVIITKPLQPINDGARE